MRHLVSVAPSRNTFRPLARLPSGLIAKVVTWSHAYRRNNSLGVSTLLRHHCCYGHESMDMTCLTGRSVHELVECQVLDRDVCCDVDTSSNRAGEHCTRQLRK